MPELEALPDAPGYSGFDQTPVDDVVFGTTEIASGVYRYGRQARRLQVVHTGSAEVFLTQDQEQESATIILASTTAQAGIDELAKTDSEAAANESVRYAHLIAEGKKAEHKLIETNLRFAAYYARASMNIVQRRRGAKGGTEVSEALDEDALQLSLKPRDKVIGAYSDITNLRSRHADLEDRMQVASLGLVKAAHTFRPMVSARSGKPVKFITHAAYYIQRELTRYAKTRELPGWYVPDDSVNEIYTAQKRPEDFTPDKLGELQAWDEGRRAVSLDELGDLDVPD